MATSNFAYFAPPLFGSLMLAVRPSACFVACLRALHPVPRSSFPVGCRSAAGRLVGTLLPGHLYGFFLSCLEANHTKPFPAGFRHTKFFTSKFRLITDYA